MKHYPSISYKAYFNTSVHAFDKLDGSNIRAEWSRKRNAFYKFGSRSQLLNSNDPVLGPAARLVQEKYELELSAIFSRMKIESVVCFFEFFGQSSFAGQHRIDENHDVVLIDVAPYKRGILPPNEFIDLCGHLHIPRVLHVGSIDEAFLTSVKDGSLPGMTFEGVVCKFPSSNGKMTSMFKVKTAAWLSKLRELCAGDERKFNELK